MVTLHMSRAVVAFLQEERLVYQLVEKDLVMVNELVAVSPLFVASTRVTVLRSSTIQPKQTA